MRSRFAAGVVLVVCLCLMPTLLGQKVTRRPNPSDPAHPYSTPEPVAAPASRAQLERWRQEVKAALYISNTPPPLAVKKFGRFTPTPGVMAERLTYGTNFGMRIPAIVYRPAHAAGRMPGLVVVNGHQGDKTSWYAYYTGILYARAGAVVVTYDPIGEDERNSGRKSETHTHDQAITGPHTPARMGGEMITDVMQAVSYLRQRPDVDSKRIAILGYSMGSFVSALTGAVDPRIHVVVLSGGGDLDGNMGSWDRSSKVMCQSGPYRALSFLPDKAAILYALNQLRGPTFVINGTVDKLVARPHHFEPFFEDLRLRVNALTGAKRGNLDTYWVQGAGHRPSWVTRPAALWLQAKLNFPNWTPAKIEAMNEIEVNRWAAKTGAHVNANFVSPLSEGGMIVLAGDVPSLSRAQLQAVPLPVWQREKDEFVWEAWVRHALAADGINGADLSAYGLPPKAAKSK